jgi:hypothetical protein
VLPEILRLSESELGMEHGSADEINDAGYLWRGRDLAWRSVLIATIVLLALGFVGTFPTFFEAFAD